MHKDELPIGRPCEESWDDMRGDAKQRHCASCDKEVYDLSAMTQKKAQDVLARRAAGQRLCVRYSFNEVGQLDFQRESLIPPALLLRGRQVAMAAGLAAAAMSGCLPAGSAVGSATSHRAAEELGERGACSLSLEPVLPITVKLHAKSCEPPPPPRVVLGQLSVPPPVPEPLPEPPPLPPTPPPPALTVSEPAPPAASQQSSRRMKKAAKKLEPPQRRWLMGDLAY
jgi:hypothetical protein